MLIRRVGLAEEDGVQRMIQMIQSVTPSWVRASSPVEACTIGQQPLKLDSKELSRTILCMCMGVKLANWKRPAKEVIIPGCVQRLYSSDTSWHPNGPDSIKLKQNRVPLSLWESNDTTEDAWLKVVPSTHSASELAFAFVQDMPWR